MSTTESTWVSDAQYRSIHAGLRVVEAWGDAEHDPEEALSRALRAEADPADLVIGLATLSRLLALELAAAAGVSEAVVLARVRAVVERLQRE
ncbi:hypothetical protein [Microbacterium trichothecenolyticum]|uniref:Uncharacterized protein n=1 Tax=Microbacterium trichothecenolyticum TaxID=69370 RepID=A0ABU0TSF0_MICTR|nr:hypothetical protein [Microbacterium trichothecenolyticum]MDQ1122598.1 hypothetical protein [Microbacterium trichothecenolyticum]